MDTNWTGAGAASLRNGEYARFSPQWVFSKSTLEPLGLPINVGGLVNRAAFKTIAPVVSARAGTVNWFPGDLAESLGVGSGGRPGDAIIAAARELRRKDTTSFPTSASALVAYLRTSRGDIEYRYFVAQMRSGRSS
jgi:hypothetical protein